MEHAKVCPFAAANPQQENSDCLGEACECYVKMHKPCLIPPEQCEVKFFYRYKGCGLVAHVPWELVKREDLKKGKPKPVN